MLLQGILLGISLSFLIGPLLFAIIEAGIAQGFRAGMAVASGIWVSDILFVVVAIYSMEAITQLSNWTDFRFWAELCGGLLLMLFGLGSTMKSFKKEHLQIQAGSKIKPAHRRYVHWWLRGFLLNTINPGTIFFWMGILGGVVAPNRWGRSEMLVFFGGMLSTLILTDTGKAWGAKAVRNFLTPAHVQRVQLFIGLLLLLFGLVLVVRALNG